MRVDYDRIDQLLSENKTVKEIYTELDIGRSTVQKYIRNGKPFKQKYYPSGKVPGRFIVDLVFRTIPEEELEDFTENLGLSLNYFHDYRRKEKKWMAFDTADLIITKGLNDPTIWRRPELLKHYLNCDIRGDYGKKPVGSPRRSEHLNPEIHRLILEGLPFYRIAEILKISRATITRYASKTWEVNDPVRTSARTVNRSNAQKQFWANRQMSESRGQGGEPKRKRG